MLRRTRRVLTPEEAERQQQEDQAGPATIPTKPTLLSRLHIKRSAGEGRFVAEPAERTASQPPDDTIGRGKPDA